MSTDRRRISWGWRILIIVAIFMFVVWLASRSLMPKTNHPNNSSAATYIAS